MTPSRMNTQKALHILNEDWEDEFVPVLDSFLAMILPALSEKAEEIKICRIPAKGQIQGITATYKKEDNIFPLTPHKDFRAVEAFTRIRIISGMSIVPGMSSSGEMHLRLENVRLVVDVRFNQENGAEILVLKVDWVGTQ